MKMLLLLPLLLLSLHGSATRKVIVADSTVTTAPGVGGNAQIGYAFAAGDVITMDARASKQLQLMLVYIFPEHTMGRVKLTKHAQLTFTMPEDGIVVYRFISDRGGTNVINFTVTRMPASDEVQHYNTKVVWQVPADHAGAMIPERAEE